jgi:hypothetical protein
MRQAFRRVVESLDDYVLGFHTFVDLQTQMRKGFQRVEESLDDIALDSPLVKPAFTKIKQQAEQQGWLI